MELVLSIGATLGTATATGAAVAGTAAAGAAGGSALLGIAAGATTAFSVLAAVGQGIAQKKEAYEEARFEEIRAGQESVAGRDEANSIRRRLTEILGEQQVAYAAAGVKISSGAMLAADSKRQADTDIRRTMTNSQIRSGGYLASASALRRRGRAALAQGIIKGLQSGSDYLIDLKERG